MNPTQKPTLPRLWWLSGLAILGGSLFLAGCQTWVARETLPSHPKANLPMQSVVALPPAPQVVEQGPPGLSFAPPVPSLPPSPAIKPPTTPPAVAAVPAPGQVSVPLPSLTPGGGQPSQPTRTQVKDPYLRELVEVLGETRSVDAFLAVVTVLARENKEARAVVPAVIRNAERLGIFGRFALDKDAPEAQLAQNVTELLDQMCRQNGVSCCTSAQTGPISAGPVAQAAVSAAKHWALRTELDQAVPAEPRARFVAPVQEAASSPVSAVNADRADTKPAVARKLTVANMRKEPALLFQMVEDGKFCFVQKLPAGEAIEVSAVPGKRWLAIFGDNPAGVSFDPTQETAIWLLR